MYTVCPQKSVILFSENIPKPRNKFWNFFNCTDTPNLWPKHMWVWCKFSHTSLHNIQHLFRGFGIFVTLFGGHTVSYSLLTEYYCFRYVMLFTIKNLTVQSFIISIFRKPSLCLRSGNLKGIVKSFHVVRTAQSGSSYKKGSNVLKWGLLK